MARSEVAALLLLCSATGAWADTITLVGKKSIKGVIVGESADRYVINTVDGERAVPKDQVRAVRYDDPEQSHYQVGRQMERAGLLREALTAYQRAMAAQPDFQAARIAAFHVQRQLWRQDEAQLTAEISRKRALLEQMTRGAPPLVPSFEERFGCRLGYEEGWTVVAGVNPGSPAALAGLTAGDLFMALGSEPIAHASPQEISRRLREGGGEFLVTIERIATADHPRGIMLEMSYDGLRVAGVAPQTALGATAVMVGDFLVAINGRPARYLDLPQGNALLTVRPRAELMLRRTLILRERRPP